MTIPNSRINHSVSVLFVMLALLIAAASVDPVWASEAARVKVVNDQSGSKIQVNGADFMILGMNWGYVPIGKNYAYSLWIQSDDFIEAALAREMPLLKSMGINTIRHYVGIPPRWVSIYMKRMGFTPWLTIPSVVTV